MTDGTYVVVGPPGVGKTSIVSAAVDRLDDVEAVSFGHRMVERGEAVGYMTPDDHDVSLARFRELQEFAAGAVVDEAEADGLVVDTHAAVRLDDEHLAYVPGLPANVVARLDPTVVVVVDASAEVILARRREDADGNRPLLSPAEIDDHRETSRRIGETAAVLAGSRLRVIENPPGALDAAADALVDSITRRR